MYECQICHRVFGCSSSYDYHILKRVCQKTNQRQCPTCKHIFSTKNMCQYHVSHNVCTKTPNKPKIVLKRHNTDLSREELLEKLEQTESELRKLEGKYEILKEIPTTQINNNVYISFPLPFGEEKMNHITQKLGDIIGPLIKKYPHNSIPALFQKIHNNEQLPEYHNVYSSSERSTMALVSDGTRFIYCPKKTIIDEIIEEKRSLINSYIDDNGDKLGQTVLEKYDRYQDRLDQSDEFRKDLEIEIGAMLLNMKSVIDNDDKTRRLLETVGENPVHKSSTFP